MTKSGQLWRDDLNDQICWRFSNYKFTVKNTHSKLERDLEYLKTYYTHLLDVDGHSKSGKPLVSPVNGLSTNAEAPSVRSGEYLDWKFPLDAEEIKTMKEWVERMIIELDQLIPSLDEVTAMAFNPFFPITNWTRVIIISTSIALISLMNQITEWSI